MEFPTDKKTIVATSIYGVISFIMIVRFLGSGMGVALPLIGIAFAMLPVPVFLYLVLRRDAEPEPWSLMLPSFIWGATVAIALALIFNNVAIAVTPFTEDQVTVFAAPFVEEFLKALPLCALVLFFRKNVNSVRDAIVYASLVGLGFAMTENVIYYMGAFAEGGMKLIMQTFVGRGLASFNAHAAFTSITGVGLYLAISDKVKSKALVVVAGFVMAVAFHMAWNASALFGGQWFFMMWFVVYIPALLFIIYYRGDKKALEEVAKPAD